jgi:hypothetical protein
MTGSGEQGPWGVAPETGGSAEAVVPPGPPDSPGAAGAPSGPPPWTGPRVPHWPSPDLSMLGDDATADTGPQQPPAPPGPGPVPGSQPWQPQAGAGQPWMSPGGGWSPQGGWVPQGPPPQGAWAPPPRRSRKPFVIGCLLVIVLFIVGVGACTAVLLRSFGVAADVMAASGGQIDGFHANTINGTTSVTFQAARGVTEAQGTTLACTVIKPKLAGTEWAGVTWVLVNRAGDVIASDRTACP